VSTDPGRRVSVVIPARNEAHNLGRTLAAVFGQVPPGVELEVIVADDGSTDDTAAVACGAGARVIPGPPGAGGSPGAARNRGAAVSTGDPIVFLDADCEPAPGWLDTLLDAHWAGERVVGGSLDIPEGLPASARCDHYCGSYHVHPGLPAGRVPNHTPANLSVRREAFLSTAGFAERLPVSDGHEELRWQAELARTDAGGRPIRFEPRARVLHHNRLGLGNLLRRNYRWGYSAIESKSASGASRWAWLFRHPWLLVAASLPLAFAHTVHTAACWARRGRLEPVAMLPLILLARLAYGAGMAVGGSRWLRRRRAADSGAVMQVGPRWR
jgi:glycosyltransferase involved in cell wall biosynthesis